MTTGLPFILALCAVPVTLAAAAYAYWLLMEHLEAARDDDRDVEGWLAELAAPTGSRDRRLRGKDRRRARRGVR